MDEQLRSLLRKVQIDPSSLPSLAAQLIRSGRIQDIEMDARLGDMDAIRLYLRVLHYTKEVDLNNLWLTPYVQTLDQFLHGPQLTVWPYVTPWLPAMPFDLDQTTLQDVIEPHYLEMGPYRADSILGAYIVDAADLELADAATYHMNLNLGNSGHADLVRGQAVNSMRFVILSKTSILRMDSKGNFRLSADEDYPHVPDRYRSTADYFRSVGEFPRWPRRQIKQQLPFIAPRRHSNEPYVLVLHLPTRRAYILGGNYSLITENATYDQIIHAMRYHLQEQEHWLPSSTHQMPAWAHNLPEEEFVAFWMAD